MSPRVQGYCPACGGESLFLGSGGYVTCSRLDCRNPSAASDILDDRETEHVVTLWANDFSIRHPLRERLNGDLNDCKLHQQLKTLAGPPRVPGQYRVYMSDDWPAHAWESIAEAQR